VSGHVHGGELVAVRGLARDVVEYRLRVESPLQFRPGQFISLRVGLDADHNPILRSYSLASSPGSTDLSLVVKLVPGGTASGWFNQLKTGDQVEFTGPMGFFVLDLQHAGDVVFGATGVGVAPVLPMAREALTRSSERGRVLLFWGNRQPDEWFWRDELTELERDSRFSVHRFLSGGAPEWAGARGRIVQPICDELSRLVHPTFYLVGNGAMIRDAKAALIERGVDRKRQIRNEVFFD
jgi:ferredoxin-NADP reductase